jgi:hypothetical protein
MREKINAETSPPTTALNNVNAGFGALRAISKPIPVTEETASKWLNENVKINRLHPVPTLHLK